MKDANPTLSASHRHLRGFSVAMAAYVIVILLTVTYVNRVEPQGAIRYLAILSPLVPIGFMAATLVRFFRDTDEFQRRVVTESLAIAAGVTAILAVTYGFLESTGLPHPSAWVTWIVVMGSWAVARVFVARRYR